MASNDDLFESFTHANKKYYIMEKWTPTDEKDYFNVIITDSTNYWSGNYTKSQFKEAVNLTDFDLDGVKAQMIRAFRNKSEFLLAVKLSANYVDLTLTIKKVLERDCKVEIASLNLKIVDDPTFKSQETFDYCIHRIRTLENKLETLIGNIKLLDAEKSDALKTLEECVKQKEDIEFDLYSKFVHILNAKKQKIRELVAENSE